MNIWSLFDLLDDIGTPRAPVAPETFETETGAAFTIAELETLGKRGERFTFPIADARRILAASDRLTWHSATQKLAVIRRRLPGEPVYPL